MPISPTTFQTQPIMFSLLDRLQGPQRPSPLGGVLDMLLRYQQPEEEEVGPENDPYTAGQLDQIYRNRRPGNPSFDSPIATAMGVRRY